MKRRMTLTLPLLAQWIPPSPALRARGFRRSERPNTQVRRVNYAISFSTAFENRADPGAVIEENQSTKRPSGPIRYL